MDAITQKQHLRESIKERLKHLPMNERTAESRTLCKELLHALPKTPLIISTYLPTPNEADVTDALKALLEQGCKLYGPSSVGQGFEFRRFHSMSELIPGRFDIREPLRSNPELRLEDVDYVFVPGVGFDRQGHRLGRGNGGYDRWLQKLRAVNTKVKVWGIAFEFQLTDSVPVEAHDQIMDGVFTARGLIEKPRP
jgi:5-formyltetrahydrofolate cyclo-ligase